MCCSFVANLFFVRLPLRFCSFAARTFDSEKPEGMVYLFPMSFLSLPWPVFVCRSRRVPCSALNVCRTFVARLSYVCGGSGGIYISWEFHAVNFLITFILKINYFDTRPAPAGSGISFLKFELTINDFMAPGRLRQHRRQFSYLLWINNQWFPSPGRLRHQFSY